MKMTASQIRELGKTHPAVATQIQEYVRQYRTRNVRHAVRAAGWRCYLDEGAEYTFHSPDGRQLKDQMLSESTVGAKPKSFGGHVAKQTPGLPEGTMVVKFSLFLGMPIITLYVVGQLALEAK